MKHFHCGIAILCLSVLKVWHESVRIFVDLWFGSDMRILNQYLLYNALGLTVGGISAGVFTDSYGYNVILPTAIFVALISSLMIKYIGIKLVVTLLLLTLQSALYRMSVLVDNKFISFLTWTLFILTSETNVLTSKFSVALIVKINLCLLWFLSKNIRMCTFGIVSLLTIMSWESSLLSAHSEKLVQFLLFIRGVSIAFGMNACYATIASVYKNTNLMGKATSVLYIFLFSVLSIAPPMIHSRKISYETLTLITLTLFGLSLMLPKTVRTEIRASNVLKMFKEVAQNSNIITCASCSWILIGGFYNMITFITACNFPNTNIPTIQSVARILTVISAVPVIFIPKKFGVTSKNCAKYMMISVSMSIFSLILLILSRLLSNIYIAQLGIYLASLTTGFAQPAAKAAILASANRASKSHSLAGTAQSCVTFGNSFIESVGTLIILSMSPKAFILASITLSIISLIFIHRRKLEIADSLTNINNLSQTLK